MTRTHRPRAARALAAAAALSAVAAAGCRDFLTGGDLSNDPNRPLAATPAQLFVGAQTFLTAFLLSDPVRITGMYVQQFEGTNQQYVNIYQYGRDESTTNGFYQGIYGGGGLIDLRRLQAAGAAAGDSTFVGIGQVQEALLIGTAADVFGDVVYSEALKGTPNPPLDDQLAVYDAVQVLLSKAITNLAAEGPTNVGPQSADLVYGGDRARWTALAHTLKARFYLHTAEVRGAPAYQGARTEASLGITEPSGDYVVKFSGAANEQNLFYQFNVVQRAGYLSPNPFFVDLLQSRDDPRLAAYFNADQSDLSDPRLQPNYTQPVVTANENVLVWAEAAERGGNDGVARGLLDTEREFAGLGPADAALTGDALLREILTEKYVALFQTIEVWNDYKRTCFPNLAPVVDGTKIPARLLYDAAERQTNTNIPAANAQPFRNRNDPPNATADGTGEACLGQ